MAEQIFASIPWIVLLIVFIGEKLQQWSISRALDRALQRAQTVLPAAPVAVPALPAPSAPATPPKAPAPAAAPPAAVPTAVVDPGLVAFVKKAEAFSAKAYWDYKQYSIGYGTKATSANEVIDEAEAERRLAAEIGKAAHIVEAFAPHAPIGVKQALTDLTYNAGPGWEQQGLGDLIKAGNYEEAKSHLRQYNHASGQVLDGLTKRREAEISWFDHPL